MAKAMTWCSDAHGMLNELPLNYVGFIEGHDIFAGEMDIAVCDGFAGNLILKSTEGLARMMLTELKATFNENWVSKLGGHAGWFLIAPSAGTERPLGA